jgi:hypothetical protein
MPEPSDISAKFQPDYTPEQLENLGVYDSLCPYAAADALLARAFAAKPDHSVLGEKRRLLAKVCCDIAAKNLPGHVAECGVYKGGAARILATAFETKDVLLFDSFQGFICDDSMPNQFHTGSFGDTSLEAVRAYLDDKPNCRFYPGWLPVSAKDVHAAFCFVHMDMDHYDSTSHALSLFWPKIVPGGAILFDDWDDVCCPGIRRAITEFFPDTQVLDIHQNQCLAVKT